MVLVEVVALCELNNRERKKMSCDSQSNSRPGGCIYCTVYFERVCIDRAPVVEGRLWDTQDYGRRVKET